MCNNPKDSHSLMWSSPTINTQMDQTKGRTEMAFNLGLCFLIIFNNLLFYCATTVWDDVCISLVLNILLKVLAFNYLKRKIFMNDQSYKQVITHSLRPGR